MAKKRIAMAIQEEIARLRGHEHSQRKVAKILGINRNTVAQYWNFGPTETAPPREPDWVKALDWNYLEMELTRGALRKTLYEEIKDLYSLPSYVNFCRYLRIKLAHLNQPEVTIRIVREPGQSVEVDYAGSTWPILEPATGEIRQVSLFVAAMSYSSYIYAEFTETQRMEDFIDSHNNLFFFLGGVPRFTIPDNCLTAVSKADKYDPELNPTYHDMCVHYKTAVDPTRVRHPKDKPVVERSVGILESEFFSKFRNKTYTSLIDLNRDLREYLLYKNAEEMKERGKSRNEFFKKEKEFLIALPDNRYELFCFKKAKVHPDCHIQHARNFYSVPYRYVGQEVRAKFNHKMIYIYVGTECVAVHSIQKGHGHYCTNEAHYPEDKVVDLHMNLLGARVEATKVGPNTSTLIEQLIRAERHPLKNLRKIQGIISLSSKYSKEAMEFAASMAVEHNKLFYGYIKQCAEYYRPPKPAVVFSAPVRQLELICLQGGLE